MEEKTRETPTTIGEKPAPELPKIERRDFLRLSGVAAAALVLSKGLIKKTPEETSFSQDILKIETPEATFFPVYEEHTKPVKKEQLEEFPPLDLYFYEYLEPSDKLLRSTPEEIINFVPGIANTPGSERQFIITREHLEFLRKNNTKISIEGYEAPQNFFVSHIVFQGAESMVGFLGATKHFIIDRMTGKRKADEEGNNKQTIKDAAVALAATWAVSPTLVQTLFFYGDPKVKQNAVDRIMSRTAAMVTHAHPEQLLILFRNILMARKLQFLGGHLSKNEERKAKIAYNVGKLHSGIEDFLNLGKEFTLYVLEKFPNKPLREIIDKNGGIESFCSVIIINPDKKLPAKQVVIDQELKGLLQKKLG